MFSWHQGWGTCHTPFFDHALSFYSSFEPILPSYFLKFLHFISQYFTVYFAAFYCVCFNILFCLYFSILSVHFANTLFVYSSNFYPYKSHFFYQTFYLFVLQRFTFIFSFYSPLKTEKSRRFRRNFGKEVTMQYLIWFRRNSFKSYYFFFYLIYF